MAPYEPVAPDRRGVKLKKGSVQGESSEMLEEGFVGGLQGLLEERVINSLEGVGYKSEEQEQELQVGSARGPKVAGERQGSQVAKACQARVASCKSGRNQGCTLQKQEKQGLWPWDLG